MSFSYIREKELTLDEVKWLETEARDYCVSHGMVYKDSEGRLQHIPVTLLPSPFPQKQFTAAKEVQCIFNLLVHRVSQDYEFTKKALAGTLAADPFTSKLFDIYDKVWQQGNVQSISLGIFRSDYLIDKSDGLHRCSDNSGEVTPKPANGSISIKQVEMNTISLGGITFSCFVPKMHRYLLQLIGQETSKVPLNNALDEAAGALVKAWELYGSESAVIMFVIVHGEVNIYDQKMLEYRVRERNPAVKVIRRSLSDIYHRSRTDDKKCLFVDGMEVAVAYFRSGYSPNHYPTEKEWSARLTMELTRCIKCPTVAHQLMGTKKMQQVLAEPGILERFLPDKESVERVRQTFTGLYTLDSGPKGDLNMEGCLKTVENCVLKPQREGGGNNMYGEDIRLTLLSKPENRSQYILMDRIQPEVNNNFLVRQEFTSIHSSGVVPELGIMGVFISCGDEILLNRESGFLVRTKSTEHADGGVFAGRAAFDSLYLV